ncbi:MAG: hypothetical protein HY866_04655 [Chloroflexi bacterium]|nr:hypothetical protein [Chloroflexota bacterium]
MLSQYHPVIVDLILREETPPPPFPPARDRTAWNTIRAALGVERCQAMISAAEAAAAQPFPPLSAALFLEFFRSGDRQTYETPWFQRREMLADLALAECLEDQGRFLDPLLTAAWSICEESSWEFPAHHHDLPDVEKPEIGLFAALTATQLAEVVFLLGDRCHPLLEKRIRYEVDQRILTPFLARHDFWWLHPYPGRKLNNWTGVCVGNVIAAAIYLERDTARLGEIIARGARSFDDYLATFDSEGGSTEGPAYWDFGFGNYILAADLVYQRTNGRVDFFREDIVRKVAVFPLRTILSPGRFVTFSDCDASISLAVPLLARLAQHYGLDDLMRLANQYAGKPQRSNSALSWKLRTLAWRPDPALNQTPIPARQDWYPDMQWMIARVDPTNPDALVVAAKGGHNDEMHNQNDVGNLIVHLNGISVIADIGRGRYTRQYFSLDQRYDFLVNSSLGHSLPVPNGCVQHPGEVYAARMLDHQSDGSSDRLVLDLAGAYPPEAKLAALRRTIALHRDTPRGWVELIDDVKFEGISSFESVLTTFGTVTIELNAVRIEDEGAALIVTYDPAVVTARVDLIREVDLATGPRDVRRVIFALLTSQDSAYVRLVMVPA